MSGGEEEVVGNTIDYNPHFENSPQFNSRDDAVEWCRNIALELGFLLVISSHKKRGDGLYNHCLDCDRSGKKKPRDFSVAIRRNTKRKACDCKFRLLMVPMDNYLHWVVQTLTGKGFHNHPLIEYAEGHRQISGLNPAAKKVVADLSGGHVKPSHIMKLVTGTFPNLNPNITHIYNCRYQLRKNRSEGRNAAQQFLHQAVHSNYMFWLQSDVSGMVTHTFIAHPTSVKMLRTWPHVIHIDATYKTNKYAYPLVEMVGVTPTNRNFLIAWALLKWEDAQSYRWMLESLKNLLGGNLNPTAIVTDRDLGLIKYINEVFPNSPHLLCTWHINHDVEAWVARKCGSRKKGLRFGKGSWKKVMNSLTEAEYDKNVAQMMRIWGNIGVGTTGITFPEYINGTWLQYKTKFVKCWTNQVKHFGNTTNNRAESSHSAMKTWIASPTLAMDTLFLKIDSYIQNQVIEIRNDLEASVKALSTEFNQVPYIYLNGYCSNYSLKLIQKDLARMYDLDYEVQHCGCVLQTTHGLPCGCYTFVSLEGGIQLYLQDVHPFWRTLAIGRGVDTSEILAEVEQDRQFFQSLVDQIQASDPSVMRSMSRLIHSELHPEQCAIREPEATVSSKGHSRLGKGMHRVKSGWEYVFGSSKRGKKSTSSQSHGGRSGSSQSRGGRSGSSGNISSCNDWRFDMENFEYFDRIPQAIHDYVEGWIDVVPDGNCGFRCVADAFCGGQENWDVVRRATIGELAQNGFIYNFVYGDDLSEAISRIHWEGADCTEEHYMSVVADLYPIANHYKCAIFFFGFSGIQWDNNESLTIMPLEVGGQNVVPRRELAIAHLGVYKHFIRLQLKHGHPIPTIPPRWYEHAHPSVLGWSQHYHMREQEWVTANPGIYRPPEYVNVGD